MNARKSALIRALPPVRDEAEPRDGRPSAGPPDGDGGVGVAGTPGRVPTDPAGDTGGQKWSKMVQKWSKMAKNGQKCQKMAFFYAKNLVFSEVGSKARG